LSQLERYIKYYKGWYSHFRNLQISDKIKERIKEFKKDLTAKNMVEMI